MPPDIARSSRLRSQSLNSEREDPSMKLELLGLLLLAAALGAYVAYEHPPADPPLLVAGRILAAGAAVVALRGRRH